MLRDVRHDASLSEAASESKSIAYQTVFEDDVDTTQVVQRLVEDTVFFRVVKVSPGKAKRVRVKGERGIQYDDVVVTLHQVLWASSSRKYMLLNPFAVEQIREGGTADSFILCLSCFSYDSLRGMRIWRLGENSKLEYRVDSAITFDPALKEEHKLALPVLLSDLMSSQARDGAVLAREDGSARDAHLQIQTSASHVLVLFGIQRSIMMSDMFGLFSRTSWVVVPCDFRPGIVVPTIAPRKSRCSYKSHYLFACPRGSLGSSSRLWNCGASRARPSLSDMGGHTEGTSQHPCWRSCQQAGVCLAPT